MSMEQNYVTLRVDPNTLLTVEMPRGMLSSFLDDPVSLTEEDRADHERLRLIREQERREEWKPYVAFEAALTAAVTSPLARNLLDLHDGIESSVPGDHWCSECSHCCDSVRWPCATVRAVADDVGVAHAHLTAP